LYSISASGEKAFPRTGWLPVKRRYFSCCGKKLGLLAERGEGSRTNVRAHRMPAAFVLILISFPVARMTARERLNCAVCFWRSTIRKTPSQRGPGRSFGGRERGDFFPPATSFEPSASTIGRPWPVQPRGRTARVTRNRLVAVDEILERLAWSAGGRNLLDRPPFVNGGPFVEDVDLSRVGARRSVPDEVRRAPIFFPSGQAARPRGGAAPRWERSLFSGELAAWVFQFEPHFVESGRLPRSHRGDQGGEAGA